MGKAVNRAPHLLPGSTSVAGREAEVAFEQDSVILPDLSVRV